MNLVSQVGGQTSFLSSNAIVSGAALANLSTAGMTALVSTYQDDIANSWVLPIDFYFYGTNYGKGLAGGMGWDSNFVISFSQAWNNITWPDTQPGVCLGVSDRATNTFHYSGAITSGTAKYVSCVVQGQNLYNDGLANAVKYQYRLITTPTYQFIEVNGAVGFTSQGTWKVSTGPAGGNLAVGGGAYVGTGQSGVWRSTATGTNWTWFPNRHVYI
jgi:hypothetical protein